MNARQRKKYCDYAICSHRVYNVDILSYDPYFTRTEDYCKLGRYSLNKYRICRCYNCRHFTLSRSEMKKAREIKRLINGKSKLYFSSPYEGSKEKEENEGLYKLSLEIQ